MIEINFDSEVPIYKQLVDQIIRGIYCGEIEKGQVMPSVRQLACDIGVNLHTVNKSYQILRDKGYIIMDRRQGARIAEDFKTLKPEDVESLRKNMEDILFDYFIRGLEKEDVMEIVENIYKKKRR